MDIKHRNQRGRREMEMAGGNEVKVVGKINKKKTGRGRNITEREIDRQIGR